MFILPQCTCTLEYVGYRYTQLYRDFLLGTDSTGARFFLKVLCVCSLGDGQYPLRIRDKKQKRKTACLLPSLLHGAYVSQQDASC